MKKKKEPGKRRTMWRWMIGVMICGAIAFLHVGGVHTGKGFSVEEVRQYATEVEAMEVPAGKRIYALGEATHGNREFQQLKLEVFQKLVEVCGVRAFAIEGDAAGCECVNAYIQGGSGTALEALEKIGFTIYQTKEMEALLLYMREYNKAVSDAEKLRFYGFDMQRIDQTVPMVKALYGDQTDPEMMSHFEVLSSQYEQLKALSQDEGGSRRDQFMAENISWILAQEEKRGCRSVFVTGHNSHVARWESYESAGTILSRMLGEAYYVIGTDFYKTHCNLPVKSGRRINQTFYSQDPIAKTIKMAGMESCWIDFSKVPTQSELGRQIHEYMYMGSLGEMYSVMMRFLPPSYRIFQVPAKQYDGMIFVTEAHPIKTVGSENKKQKGERDDGKF